VTPPIQCPCGNIATYQLAKPGEAVRAVCDRHYKPQPGDVAWPAFSPHPHDRDPAWPANPMAWDVGAGCSDQPEPKGKVTK